MDKTDILEKHRDLIENLAAYTPFDKKARIYFFVGIREVLCHFVEPREAKVIIEEIKATHDEIYGLLKKDCFEK